MILLYLQNLFEQLYFFDKFPYISGGQSVIFWKISLFALGANSDILIISRLYFFIIFQNDEDFPHVFHNCIANKNSGV